MISHDQYFRETWVEVNLDAIANNLSKLKTKLPDDVAIIAVVKANAYGHGAVQVARAALLCGARYLAVACLDEALSLREHNVNAPIIVLGATSIRHVKVAADYDITLTAIDEDWLLESRKVLERENLQLKVHVKIDTGMGRIGIQTLEEFSKVLAIIDEKNIQLDGVFTHFSTADELDDTYFKKQLETFEKFLSRIKKNSLLIHSSNSAACLRFPKTNFNAVRFGIGMYGHTPSLEVEGELPFELEPAFSFYTTIAQVKEVPAGTKISYGATYEAAEREWIATIPVGYADGWFRKLQGQEVLVDGIRVPIVGRICMDQCMLRLQHKIPVGTKVTLIGKSGSDTVLVNEIAKKLGTINYEVLCGVSVRVPRVFVKDGKVAEVYNGMGFRL